jgi:hypothetical protein
MGGTCLAWKMYQISLAVLLFSIILTPLSDAEMGYYVDARVNSTSWSIERTTRNLNFEITGSVSGYGSFSRLTHIQNFVGIESHELTSSPSSGNLSYDEMMVLQSREGAVTVGTNINSGSNESTNESVDVSSDEFIYITIDEHWPARLSNYKKISYLGPGIRTRESYQNNGDVVETSIDSWRLTKESVYQAQINRSVTTANITSDDVVVDTSSNKSSVYGLALNTIGSSTHLDVMRLDELGEPTLYISQDYLGEEHMNLNITMGDYVPSTEDEEDWLECCRSGEAKTVFEDSLTPSLDRFIT